MLALFPKTRLREPERGRDLAWPRRTPEGDSSQNILAAPSGSGVEVLLKSSISGGLLPLRLACAGAAYPPPGTFDGSWPPLGGFTVFTGFWALDLPPDPALGAELPVKSSVSAVVAPLYSTKSSNPPSSCGRPGVSGDESSPHPRCGGGCFAAPELGLRRAAAEGASPRNCSRAAGGGPLAILQRPEFSHAATLTLPGTLP
mmetsp:Transcript_36838/g.68613  ORF Transcript_36838/g.68613 Transcript_36838/m.68613 type:complete len:201 (-) Transcript_36838:3-605(-)